MIKLCRIFKSLHDFRPTAQKIDYWVGGEEQCTKCGDYRHCRGKPLSSEGHVNWIPGKYIPVPVIPPKVAKPEDDFGARLSKG